MPVAYHDKNPVRFVFLCRDKLQSWPIRLRRIFIDYFLLGSWPRGLYKMFIDFRSIFLIEERSKTFLAKSSNLSGEEVLPTTATKTWRPEHFQVSFNFDNRYADRKFKTAFSHLKNKKWQRTLLLQSRVQVLERLLKARVLKWLQKR